MEPNITTENLPIREVNLDKVAVAVFGFGDTLIMPRVLLTNAIRNGLTAEVVQFSNWTLFAVDGYAIHIFDVPDRLAALRAAKTVIQGLGLELVSAFGFLDLDEGFWRTVWPVGQDIVNSLITPANIARAEARAKLITDMFRQKLSAPPAEPPKVP